MSCHHDRLRMILFPLLIFANCPAVPAELPKSKHELAVRSSAFTINDKPVFLLGCSYYGALGGNKETWQGDLDDMQKGGINWIRVWATWAAFEQDVSAVKGETGQPRPEYLDVLRALIVECDRREMIVDVTLSRQNSVSGPARLQSIEAHQQAVETLVTALKPWRNWYLDLSNERNLEDKRFTSFADLKRLRARVRELDPQRLVTASHAGDLTQSDLREYVLNAGVDFVSPHRPRNADSPGQTEAMTRKWLAQMKELGKVVPIHHQEPFRRGYGFAPEVKDYETDLAGAIAGGAAGWCFHNGDTREAKDGRPRRSFDIRSQRLFEQLDEVEQKAVLRFPEVVKAARLK